MDIRDLETTSIKELTEKKEKIAFLYNIKSKEYYIFNMQKLFTRSFWYNSISVYVGIGRFGIIYLRNSDWRWDISTELLLCADDLIDILNIPSLTEKERKYLEKEKEKLIKKVLENSKYKKRILD